MGAPFKMKGFSGFGNSPLEHYTGPHKGAKKHPPHKLSDVGKKTVKEVKKGVEWLRKNWKKKISF